MRRGKNEGGSRTRAEILHYFIYLLLLLPPSFLSGMVSREKRLQAYLLVGLTAAAVLLLLALHAALGHRVPPYRRFYRTHRRGMILLFRGFRFVCFLVLVVLYAVVFLPIYLGIDPVSFLLLTAAVATVYVLGRLPSVRLPLSLNLYRVVLLYTYASLLAIFIHYLGSRTAVCDAMEEQPHVRVLWNRHDTERTEGLSFCYPYDVRFDAATERLFFTLKEVRAGLWKKVREDGMANDAIVRMDLSPAGGGATEILPVRGASGSTYPQRITLNPARDEMYVVVLDIDGDHQIFVLRYQDAFSLVRSLHLDFEPIRAYFDNDRRQLILPHYEAGVSVYDLDDDRLLLRRRYTGLGHFGLLGLLDTFVRDAKRNLFYATTVGPYQLAIDADTYEILRRKRIFVPTIGMDYDPVKDRMYLAGTFSREILVLAGGSLALLARRFPGTTAREISLDRGRGLLYVGGYCEGYLDLYDPETLERLARVFLGKLLRSLHFDPASGRLFAATGCGVYEIDVDGLLGTRGE